MKNYFVDGFVQLELLPGLVHASGELGLVLEGPEGDLAILGARDCAQIERVARHAAHRAVVSRRLAVRAAPQARLHVVQVDVAGRVADQAIVATRADCATLVKFFTNSKQIKSPKKKTAIFSILRKYLQWR